MIVRKRTNDPCPTCEYDGEMLPTPSFRTPSGLWSVKYFDCGRCSTTIDFELVESPRPSVKLLIDGKAI